MAQEICASTMQTTEDIETEYTRYPEPSNESEILE